MALQLNQGWMALSVGRWKFKSLWKIYRVPLLAAAKGNFPAGRVKIEPASCYSAFSFSASSAKGRLDIVLRERTKTAIVLPMSQSDALKASRNLSPFGRSTVCLYWQLPKEIFQQARPRLNPPRVTPPSLFRRRRPRAAWISSSENEQTQRSFCP